MHAIVLFFCAQLLYDWTFYCSADGPKPYSPYGVSTLVPYDKTLIVMHIPFCVDMGLLYSVV